MIVFAAGDNGDGSYGAGFYQVPLAAPRLEPLPLATWGGTTSGPDAARAPFLAGQLVEDKVYWVTEEYPRLLQRAGFDDAQPEVLMQAVWSQRQMVSS